jgi:uncharacterized lipoprotein
MKTTNLILIAIMSFFLIGCSVFEKLDNSDEYKKATPSLKPLALPEDLKPSDSENYFPIADLPNGNKNTGGNVSIEPPGSNLQKHKK